MLGVTPKTFPSHDIGSENVMIVKNMLFASSAAYDYRKDKSRVIITTFGPTTMRACGVPVEKGLEVGCPVATLVRAGYTVQDVASKSYDLAALRGAGAMVVDLLQIHELYLSGHGGAGRLRAAGYSAAELKECGTFTAWDMRQAGYSLDELRATGYSPAELRMAGFGDADAQPPDLLRHTVRPLQGTDVTALPRWLSGTSDPNIRAQIQAKVQATAQQGKGAAWCMRAAPPCKWQRRMCGLPTCLVCRLIDAKCLV